MRLILLAAFLISFSGVVFGQSGEGECKLVKEVKVTHESVPGAGDGSIELIMIDVKAVLTVVLLGRSANPEDIKIIKDLKKGFYTIVVYIQNGDCQEIVRNIEIK